MPNDESAGARPIAADAAPPALPPAAEREPKILLDHIAEISKNAAATWFGLLGILAFVGITLLGHRDVDFFARSAGTQLPLVNITVPVEAFFYIAPALVAAIYAYFHLYLMSLWDALAEAPPCIDGQPLSDRVYPWLISYAALWYRDRARPTEEDCSAPRPLGWIVVLVSVTFGWLFGIIVLAGLWWRSMPAHDEWLTLWAGTCLWFAALIGLTGFASGARRMAGDSRAEAAVNHGVGLSFAAAFFGLTAFLSWETTEGGFIPHDDGSLPPLLVSANLREAEITPRPSDWKPFELWLRDLRRERSIGDADQNPLIPTKEEMERYRGMIAGLDAPVFKERDFRRADLASAFLPGADLRGVDARGARLERVQIAGARLGCPTPDIELGETVCVRLQGAILWGAQMQGAILLFAQMQGAELFGAQMEGATLLWAQMQGADLGTAKMHGADFRGAQMQGTVLERAQMQGSDCTNAAFVAALVYSADLTCRDGTLTQDQLRFTVGDGGTRLPEGLFVWSCLDRNGLPAEVAAEIDAALAHHPEEETFRITRAGFEAALYCDPKSDDLLLRWPHMMPEPVPGRPH